MLKKFNTALVIIIFSLWILFPLLLNILGVEFATDTLKMNFKEFLFFAAPTVILLTLFKTIKKNDRWTTIVAKILGTIGVGLCIMFLMLLSIFTRMCLWTNEKVLFEHQNRKSKIIVRSFGCGATDKVDYFTKFFIRVSEVDTAKLDKDIWLKPKK